MSSFVPKTALTCLMTDIWGQLGTGGIYIVDDDFVKTRRAIYAPIPGGGIIKIHRSNRRIPNISYMNEIASLLHEFGHHQNIILSSIKKNYALSKTGYVYGTDKRQLYYMLKEEHFAWINAFKTLWKCKKISFKGKSNITFSMFFQAIGSLIKYYEYVMYYIDREINL